MCFFQPKPRHSGLEWVFFAACFQLAIAVFGVFGFEWWWIDVLFPLTNAKAAQWFYLHPQCDCHFVPSLCVCVFLFSDSDLSSTGDEPMHIYPIPRQAMNQSTLPDCSVCSRKPAGGLDDGGGVHNTMYIFIHINTRVYMYNYVYIYIL